jgi:hypothetical protein
VVPKVLGKRLAAKEDIKVPKVPDSKKRDTKAEAKEESKDIDSGVRKSAR